MKGNSKTYPARVINFNPGYQVRWNIEEKDVDGEISYNFECNNNYIPTELTKKEVMIAIIRERYDADDELALSFNRSSDAADIAEHEAYVEFARLEAENIINS